MSKLLNYWPEKAVKCTEIMNKLILIAFNAKIGMKLILDSYRVNFSQYFNLYVLTDKEYAK
ncbi:MAG: hypothetical protein ACKPCK_05420, partial [Dolichospermum sp.]